MDGKTLAAEARRAESMGFDALVVPDHLIEQLSPIPALATVAAATERLRIAAVRPQQRPAPSRRSSPRTSPRSTCCPAGDWTSRSGPAGTSPSTTPSACRSIRRRSARRGSTEAIAVLKGCFGDGPFSFAGEHYTITDYDGQPKPVQRPHPPFLIGGGGRRTLSWPLARRTSSGSRRGSCRASGRTRAR